MKKRGFTLIELLAVIVILAIIALIATPIVMNTIEKSKKSAAERSADNYIDAVETALASSLLDNTKLPDGTYKISSDGNICVGRYDYANKTCLDRSLVIDSKGDRPTDGNISFSDNKIMGYKFNLNNESIVYTHDSCFATESNGNGTLAITNYYCGSITSDGSEPLFTHLDVVIPSNIDGKIVTEIADNSFGGQNIETLILSDNIVIIGEGAFTGAVFPSVIIPDSVTTIKSYAFAGNVLTSVTIPSSVTNLAEDAFDEGVTIIRQ